MSGLFKSRIRKRQEPQTPQPGPSDLENMFDEMLRRQQQQRKNDPFTDPFEPRLVSRNR